MELILSKFCRTVRAIFRDHARFAIYVLTAVFMTACARTESFSVPFTVKPAQPVTLDYQVTGDATKKLVIDLDNPETYASLSVYGDDTLLVDHLNIPSSGPQFASSVVHFDKLGDVQLTFKSNNADIVIKSVTLEDVIALDIPIYKDISETAGLDKVSSIKYGGPTIADLDNDGDYDFIVNNHNAESSKLYWNNGDGTVAKHNKNLARWFMHDLHGTAAGDYDNDGDLDIVITQGGGNGTNPSKANFYTSENSKLILTTGDVGIDRGGRGRGARWSDMDVDGDLDLLLFNETSLSQTKPQHFFYENKGDGTFAFKPVAGIQDVHPSRVLVTDINQDNIDDIILYGPLSVWQGNGDFTFTDVTSQIPTDVADLNNIMAVADLDIDNDGDLDLYLARGKEFEFGKGETPSFDFDPMTKELSIKPRGFKGVDAFDFNADEAIKFHDYYYLAQGAFRGQDYPIFLGQNKDAVVLKSGEELSITPDKAQGWPEDISENGVYFGHLGEGRWKAALVRNGDMFWGFKFSLSGVTNAEPEFVAQNRNERDVLLRNDGGVFKDISKAWNIPPGGNALGVTTGDFNNDSHQDLFVYRWGQIGARISDYMLLNSGNGNFETITMHGANDVGGPGNGDMGQAFDFDLDGDMDLLSGSEGGEWYLYANVEPGHGNYALVKVGYAPKSHVDALAAEVTLKTPSHEFRKRVGSAGEIFSQSLLNIVHFGLGAEETIESVRVRWRNGETIVMKGKDANAFFNTDKLDPTTVVIERNSSKIRKGTSIKLDASIEPSNADKTLVWSSSDESVLTVDAEGVVTAKGDVGHSATITATSLVNGLSASRDLVITEWFAVPIDSVSLPFATIEMITGDVAKFEAVVLPEYADDQSLTWSSSNEQVAAVDANGQVTAISGGQATIKAVSNANKVVSDEVEVTVTTRVEAFIKIIEAEKIKKAKHVVGDTVTLNVEYHAGTGHKVISSDEGGIRFWLRHFKSEWIPAKDMVLTDASVLKSESGSSSMTLSLGGLTPTADLPEGHFYYLRASFASSDGNSYDAGIYPIDIVASQDP